MPEVSKCLPETVRKINEKLNNNEAQLSKMPENLSVISEAITAFVQIYRKILLRGKYDKYPDGKLDRCSNELRRNTERPRK